MVSPVPRHAPRRLLSLVSVGVCLLIAASLTTLDLVAQTDLDAFMRQVLVRRDDNWKKLQQYVLDEHETIDVRGPSRLPLWGERRDYTWYIRDGFFVRSPVKVNGVTIAEAERRTFESAYLKRQQAREKRGQRGQVAIGPSGIVVEPSDRDPSPVDGEAPSVDGLLRQTRQPGFISSAYFLRFKFEEGKYALVGRETLDGRDVLKIEYYPARLFGGSDRRRNRDRDTSDEDRAYDAEFRRLMNKVAMVTLWVEPKAQQIVKYTFNNLPFDFFPGQWLLHVDDLRASMTMGQPFPDVWLPRDLEFEFGISLAVGQVDMRYALEYHDYRRPDVTANVKIR
jgi:hypothetical protein